MKTKFIPAARFHVLTPLYDALCNLAGFGRSYRMKIIEAINLPQQELRVMDAGCGSGTLAIDIKKAAPSISLHAVDADQEILAIAERKSIKANQQIYFRAAFLQKLAFLDNSFDVVYSSLVFHHLNSETKKAAMREICRVMKKGGKFLLVDFGKPRFTFFCIFSWFTVLFEEGYDNYKGRMPEMLSDAGFSKVIEVKKYRFNISFLEATK